MKFFPNLGKDSEEILREKRQRMIERQIVARDIKNPAIIAAMSKIPRHRFVEPEYISSAYEDGPLPIACSQTISQPYVVASMTEHLEPSPDKEVLEIGTGSGYQTAILAEVFKWVDTVEFYPELSRKAQQVLGDLGYTNISFYIGDGLRTPADDKKYDAIIVTAAPDVIPPELARRLAPEGRMIVPVGIGTQDLYLVTCDADGNLKKNLLYQVRFVPLQHSDL